MKNNDDRFGAVIEPLPNVARLQKGFTLPDIQSEPDDFCPDCRIKMVHLGACLSCPACGYGNCG